jgi:hypothetical protein
MEIPRRSMSTVAPLSHPYIGTDPVEVNPRAADSHDGTPAPVVEARRRTNPALPDLLA